MPVRNALDALTMRPTRFLRSAWPWRSLAYLAGGALLGGATMLALAALLAAGLLLAVVLIGLAGLVALALSGVAVGRLERWRMRLVDGEALPDPHRRPPRPGVRAWLTFRLREQATWRELGYTMASATVLCWMDALVVIGGDAWVIKGFAKTYEAVPLLASVPLSVALRRGGDEGRVAGRHPGAAPEAAGGQREGQWSRGGGGRGSAPSRCRSWSARGRAPAAGDSRRPGGGR